jgi:hypothetical protein
MRDPEADRLGRIAHYEKFRDKARVLGIEYLTQLVHSIHLPRQRVVSDVAYEQRLEKYGVPLDGELLQEYVAKDWHLNNIPLKYWDDLHTAVRERCRHTIGTNRIQSWSQADTVCVLKWVARHVMAEVPAPE